MKKAAVFIFPLLVLSFLIAANASAGTITLQPGAEGKDTWIWNTEDYSHGNLEEIRINQSSAYQQYGLIEFNLASISITPSSITSAVLGLYRYEGYDNQPLTIDSHRILSSWAEDVKWSNQPSLDPAVQSSDIISGNGWVNWDLTSLTKAWIDNTYPNYGVALTTVRLRHFLFA